MSKRTDRREAERAAHKLAYQQRRQPAPAAAPLAPSESTESDLLARAQAFFERTAPATTQTKTSDAQIQANRANAQHMMAKPSSTGRPETSTGPTSEGGKVIASRNNTHHGLAGDSEADNFKVLPVENQNTYNQLLADFRKEWKPTTPTEHDLVNRLVMHKWLRHRALRLQETLFSPETGELTDTKKFELYRRYENAHERAYNKVFADLLRLRAFQLREQNGFESQQRKNEEHQFKMQRLKNQEELKQARETVKTQRQNPEPLKQAA
jgi:hypothetical protein